MVVIVFAVFLVKSGAFKKPTLNPDAPSVKEQLSTTDESPNPTARDKFIKTMPVSRPSFNIDYISSTDGFTVQITKAPVEYSKAEALKYFRDNGLNPEKEDILFYTVAGL